MQDLPALPRTYFALRDALADPEVSVRRVVGIVEQDVGISAKILQLVNSAFFGLPREISTVHTAVSYVGIEMVQNLVLSEEVFHVFEKAKSLPGFSFEELHAHPQLTARVAGHIPVSTHTHGAAIVAGLLHDVGKLVLATRSPAHFERALAGAQEDQLPLYMVEQELMGVSHAEEGAYLLAVWGLASPVVEAAGHHDHPDRVPVDSLDAIGIVHIANYLPHELPVNPPEGELPPHQVADPGYLEALGVSDQVSEWAEFAEAAAVEMRGGEKITR